MSLAAAADFTCPPPRPSDKEHQEHDVEKDSPWTRVTGPAA